jgi:hypothetical protein
MSGSEFDYYADEERPVVVSERRSKLIRFLRLSGRVVILLGVVLIVAMYLDSLLFDHRYAFWLTEQYPLTIAGASALVIGGNACFWARWLDGRGGGTVTAFIALLILSPIAVFLLVLGLMVTATPL